ncbi:MAG: alpha/beta fold hydrolase [Solirubrobacterales bacterium]|nr:alpha/beta fold hydrolase [Solirubrobacterales bacterium]
MRHQSQEPSPEPPFEVGLRDGLAYARWLPKGKALGGVVVLHGASSCKEKHFEFASAASQAGLAVVVFDQRGHGESEGPMDGRALEDVATIASLLPADLPIALRGSSMGGFMAIAAAKLTGAAAVVAICPAGPRLLLAGLRAEVLGFPVDLVAVTALLESIDLVATVAALEVAILILHAEGDERVPIAESRELGAVATHPLSKLIVVDGGDHHSVQHDAELHRQSLNFITEAFGELGA